MVSNGANTHLHVPHSIDTQQDGNIGRPLAEFSDSELQEDDSRWVTAQMPSSTSHYPIATKGNGGPPLVQMPVTPKTKFSRLGITLPKRVPSPTTSKSRPLHDGKQTFNSTFALWPRCQAIAENERRSQSRQNQ